MSGTKIRATPSRFTGDLLILPSLEMLEMLEMSRSQGSQGRADVSKCLGVFCPSCPLLHCLILQLVEFFRYASAASAWFQEFSRYLASVDWKDLESRRIVGSLKGPRHTTASQGESY